MSFQSIFILVAFFIVCYAVIFYFYDKKIAVVFSTVFTLASLIVIGGIFFWSFGIKATVRQQIMTYVSPASQHVVYNSTVPALPLPPCSAFAYRYSEKGAVYYTRLTEKEVVKYYRKTAAREGFSEKVYTGKKETVIDLLYDGNRYLVVVFSINTRVYIKVEPKNGSS